MLQVSCTITLQDMTNCLEAFVKPFNHFISLILVFIVFAVNSWQQLNLHPVLSGKWSMRSSHGSRAEAVTSQRLSPPSATAPEHLQCHQQGPSQAQWNWGHSPIPGCWCYHSGGDDRKKNCACLEKDRDFLYGEEVEERTSVGGRETLFEQVSSHQRLQEKSFKVLKSDS